MRTTPRDYKSEDSLQREHEIELFKKMIQSAIGPFVLSIDAPWGTGKTFFTKKIISELEPENATIYINAWKSDYNTDPFVTIISELKSIVPKNDFDSLSDNFIGISKFILPTAIKLVTSGIVDIDKIADGLSAVSEKLILKKIENYESEKASIEQLKSKLQSIAQSSKNNKIVVFIDELDRCRPNYAIEFLERVKHFFEVDGFIFVLSIDESQLIESIKANYGQTFESEKYLRRFIDFKYSLKSGISRSFIEDSFKRLGLGLRISNKGSVGLTALENVVNIVEYLAKLVSLSARDINQIAAKLNLRLLSYSENSRIHLIELQVILIIVRHINKTLYLEYINNKVSVDKVINELNLDKDKFDDYGDVNNLNTFIVSHLLLQIRGSRVKSNFYNNLKSMSDEVETNENKRDKSYSIDVINQLVRYDLNTFKWVVKEFEGLN